VCFVQVLGWRLARLGRRCSAVVSVLSQLRGMSRGLDQSVLLLGGVRHRSKVPRTPGKDTVSDRTSKWNPTQFVAVRDAINSIIAGMVVGVNETASAEQILTLTVTLANGTRSVTFAPEQRVV